MPVNPVFVFLRIKPQMKYCIFFLVLFGVLLGQTVYFDQNISRLEKKMERNIAELNHDIEVSERSATRNVLRDLDSGGFKIVPFTNTWINIPGYTNVYGVFFYQTPKAQKTDTNLVWKQHAPASAN